MYVLSYGTVRRSGKSSELVCRYLSKIDDYRESHGYVEYMFFIISITSTDVITVRPRQVTAGSQVRFTEIKIRNTELFDDQSLMF